MKQLTSAVAAVLLLAVPAWAAPPEKLPAVEPAAPTKSEQAGPACGPNGCGAGATCGDCGASCGSCCKSCRKFDCGRKIARWFCYWPARTSCCCYRMPPTPPVYTYFERPTCQPVCGLSSCGAGCDGVVQKCGFCTAGHRMFGLFTGHGFGFCGSCGSCR